MDDLGEFFHSQPFQEWWNSDDHRDQVDDEPIDETSIVVIGYVS